MIKLYIYSFKTRFAQFYNKTSYIFEQNILKLNLNFYPQQNLRLNFSNHKSTTYITSSIQRNLLLGSKSYAKIFNTYKLEWEKATNYLIIS